jgi:cellulose biosynthesis protein BcsQ
MKKKLSVEDILEKIESLKSTKEVGNLLQLLYRAGALGTIIDLSCQPKDATLNISGDSLDIPRVFVLARKAASLGVRQFDFLSELADACKRLFINGHYIPEAIIFLAEALRRFSSTREEKNLANKAFDSLLAGVQSNYPEISEKCLFAIDFCLELLSLHQMDSLKKAIDSHALNRFDEQHKRLFRSTTRYLNELDLLEKTFEFQSSHFSPTQIISVHSAKGGVGKSTISIALAIQLARNNPRNRICLIDADDEGPALHYYLPVNPLAQKNASFFSDWFTSSDVEGHLPKNLIMPLSNGTEEWMKQISLIPGSVIADDIEKLDAFQRGSRPKGGNDRLLVDRLKWLVSYLLAKIKPKPFTHVIIDTAPGMAHLAYDAFLCSIELNGTSIMVLRPRFGDMLSLVSECAYLADHRVLPRLSIVSNCTKTENLNIILDEIRVVAAIGDCPQLYAYAQRFTDIDAEASIMSLVRRVWSPLKNRTQALPYQGDLMHGADLQFKRTKRATLAEIIAANPKCKELAQRILKDLNKNGRL